MTALSSAQARFLSGALVAFASTTITACQGDEAACGDAGTNSVLLDSGVCTCAPGYGGQQPTAENGYVCQPLSLGCTPNCEGRTCGDDGCGGSCGSCAGGVCNSGQCVAPEGGSPLGGPCVTDGDCAGPSGACLTDGEGFPGGYCVTVGCHASGGCAGTGTCFFTNEAQTESACFPGCDDSTDCRTGYGCDDYNVCWPGVAAGCDATSCEAGTTCASNGACVPIDPGAPSGPVPACTGLPSWECEGDEAYCGQLVPFEPVNGDGYWNYPLNGETNANQYRSYVRRDLMLLVKYAAAATRCLSEGWAYGNGGVLGLGDMSEANGDIPGTSDGEPGHPPLSHTDGHDMDIAYYQVGTDNNLLRPVCPHTSGGADQYHCVGAPDLLDAWRTALFIGKLHDSTQLWIVGVDGKVAPIIYDAMDELCSAGYLTGRACSSPRLGYETQDNGIGWYYFHHHHMHVSMKDQYGNHPEL